MTQYSDGIPEREITLQYQPLGALQDPDDPETDVDTPSVAGGTEIKLFAETIKEIFQKEPTTVPIQRGQDSHFEGDKTLIVDTLKAKHKFEITAWVYSNKQGKHSLDSSIQINNGEEAQITSDKISAEEFNKYIPVGDTGIKYDSETVQNNSQSTDLERGFDKKVVDVVSNASPSSFTVPGDVTNVLTGGVSPADTLRVVNSTGNDGLYTVSAVSYSSGDDTTTIEVSENVPDNTADGRVHANDYEMNYSRGEIKFFDTGGLNTTTETTEFLGQTINTTTVISDEIQINYTFDARAQNVARLIRRMSQLGNPLVMRMDKNEYSARSGEKDSHDYLVIPKKVSISGKSDKPDEYKLELELRKGTIEQ